MSGENPLPAVKTGAVDTHCHLFLLDREPSDAVQVARDAGVHQLVCVGIDPGTSRRSLELADSLPGVFATAGMHPNEASTFDAAAGAAIEELLQSPLTVGVGETGLDFYRERATPGEQERLFRLHIQLSRESDKPVIVHTREAWPDVLRVLDEGSAERVVLHCFSGDAIVARESERRGYYLSFAANITYPGNDHLRAAAAAVSLDRVLVETDSPFLSPQHRRGRRNAPEFIGATIEALADARGEEARVVLEATTANARAAFPRLGEWETGAR
jgi:TatD DNase family protein